MMARPSDANALGNLAIDEVVREPLQIGPAETRLDFMKSLRLGQRYSDNNSEFSLEVTRQLFRDGLLAPHRFRYVLSDGGMILDAHDSRSASIPCQNSASASA